MSHDRVTNISQLRSILLHYSWICATYLKLSLKSSSSSSSSFSELYGYITELDTFLSSPLVGTSRHAGALLVNGGGTGGENGTSALRKADTDILSKHARHTSKAVGLAPPNLSQALQMALQDYWHYLTWSVRGICVELQQNESYVQHFISRKYWHGNIQWFIFFFNKWHYNDFSINWQCIFVIHNIYFLLHF